MGDKKSRERAFLEEVRSVYPEFPGGTIVDHERPDFLVCLPSQITGIEIVDYIRSQNSNGARDRQREVVWLEFSDTARLKFLGYHSEPLLVTFFGHPLKFPPAMEVKLLAQHASELIANRAPKSLFGQVRLGNEELENIGLEQYVSAIHILRVRNEQQSLWSFQESGIVDGQIDELQTLITSKEAKVEDYLLHCDKVWLIIVADAQHVSSMVELNDAVQRHVFCTRFERVLFFDRLRKEVIPLVSCS